MAQTKARSEYDDKPARNSEVFVPRMYRATRAITWQGHDDTEERHWEAGDAVDPEGFPEHTLARLIERGAVEVIDG